MPLSKAEKAYNAIKEKIITGELPPNAIISELDFQTKLGVSRTPVREALRSLEQEGFVDIYPRKGIVVSSISLDLLKEIYETRMTIEPIITRCACGKIPDSFLQGVLERMKNPPADLPEGRIAQYYNELDSEFHTALIQYAQNRFFTTSMKLVSEHERRIRNITFNLQTNDDVVNQHLDIICAMLARDEELVERLSLQHVERAKRNAFFHVLEL